jgi:hypothetical protein
MLNLQSVATARGSDFVSNRAVSVGPVTTVRLL